MPKFSSVKNLFFATLLCYPTIGKAQSIWTYNYSVAGAADQITSCQAGISQQDWTFIVRFHANAMDIFFGRPDLALPPREILGGVIMSFKDSQYPLAAYSGDADETISTSSYFFMYPRDNDIRSFVREMKYSSGLEMIFPDGSSEWIALNGSQAALEQASQCWAENYTGQGGNNPFANSSDRTNPFS